MGQKQPKHEFPLSVVTVGIGRTVIIVDTVTAPNVIVILKGD
jgi:hypothetical protein